LRIDIRVRVIDGSDVSCCRQAGSVKDRTRLFAEWGSLIWNAVEGTGYSTTEILAAALETAIEATPIDDEKLTQAVRHYCARRQGAKRNDE
jgi:hypothetical protein